MTIKFFLCQILKLFRQISLSLRLEDRRLSLVVVYQIIQIFDLVPEHHKLIVISSEVLVDLGVALVSDEALELLLILLVLLI